MGPMNYKKLVEDYFEGLTSLDEEKILKDYLQNYHGNDPDLLEAQTIFKDFRQERDEPLNISFESISSDQPKTRIRRLWMYSGSVAAAAVLIFAFIYLFKLTGTPVVYAYVNGQPITDKELAMKYSEQALQTLSNPLSKGTAQLKHIDKLNKPAELLTVKK